MNQSIRNYLTYKHVLTALIEGNDTKTCLTHSHQAKAGAKAKGMKEQTKKVKE